MSSATKIPARVTVAEFLDWCPDDGRVWQLVDGEPVAMAPASTVHGQILAEIGALLRNHLLERGMPCDVIVVPGIRPHLEKEHNVRIPDLAIVCSPGGDDGKLLTEPVLVIEILSSGNYRETGANVWAFASIPNLREILVVSSVEVRADLLRRRDDHSWPEQPARIHDGDAALDSIGFRSPLQAFYRTTGLARPR